MPLPSIPFLFLSTALLAPAPRVSGAPITRLWLTHAHPTPDTRGLDGRQCGLIVLG